MFFDYQKKQNIIVDKFRFLYCHSCFSFCHNFLSRVDYQVYEYFISTCIFDYENTYVFSFSLITLPNEIHFFFVFLILFGIIAVRKTFTANKTASIQYIFILQQNSVALNSSISSKQMKIQTFYRENFNRMQLLVLTSLVGTTCAFGKCSSIFN